MAGKLVEDLGLVFFVEILEDVDGIVVVELADALDDGIGLELLQDFFADRIVHLGERREIEVASQKFDQARTVIGVEGLDQIADIRTRGNPPRGAETLGIRRTRWRP